MNRNPCREMTHENSDVADYSATADANEESGELQVQHLNWIAQV